MARLRRSFNADFKREAANLVLKEGYSVADASRSLDIGETALRRWIDQLEAECLGVTCSSYYGYRNRKPFIDVDQLRLRRRVNEIFTRSRSSAGIILLWYWTFL